MSEAEPRRIANGQGKPLPDFLQASGEWVIEGRVFIYRDDPAEAISGSAPRFSRQAHRTDGMPCVGFSAGQLAAELRVDVPALFEANQDGSLVFLGDMDVTPSRGGESAIAYLFRLGTREGSLTIEKHGFEGRA